MAFKKWESGNPGGRPKKLPITDRLREELAKKGKSRITNDAAIARKLITMAIAGDKEAIKEIFDRTEGKPVQRTESSGPNGGPIPIEVPGTREEIERRIAELLSKSASPRARSKPSTPQKAGGKQ